MLGAKATGAITAKAKTMYRRHLTAADFGQMAAKQTLGELVGYLKSETAYEDVLRNVQDNMIHRHQLEFLLNKHYYNVYLRLRHYVPTREDCFYDYPKRSAELRMLLSAIEYVASPTHTDFVAVLPLYLDDHLGFDVMALGQVKTYADILEVMKHTHYYTTLKRYEPPEGVRLDFASCEFALRRGYYRWLYDQIETQPAAVKKALYALFGEQVELINISNIYRMKRFYRLSPARIRELVFPHYAKITEKQMDLLIEADGIEAFWEILEHSGYDYAFTAGDHSFIENITHKLKASLSRKQFRFASTPAVIYATYMTLMEIEIENITYVVEGVSFGLASQEIIRLLIL